MRKEYFSSHSVARALTSSLLLSSSLPTLYFSLLAIARIFPEFLSVLSEPTLFNNLPREVSSLTVTSERASISTNGRIQSNSRSDESNCRMSTTPFSSRYASKVALAHSSTDIQLSFFAARLIWFGFIPKTLGILIFRSRNSLLMLLTSMLQPSWSEVS